MGADRSLRLAYFLFRSTTVYFEPATALREGSERSLGYGFSYLCHELLIEGEVVDRRQRERGDLVDGEEVSQVSAREARLTGRARARRVEGREVLAEARVPQLELLAAPREDLRV